MHGGSHFGCVDASYGAVSRNVGTEPCVAWQVGNRVDKEDRAADRAQGPARSEMVQDGTFETVFLVFKPNGNGVRKY
jgi:hypothetical protein